VTNVKRKERESLEAMLRRFNRKVQESGLVLHARNIRFHEPEKSPKQRKKQAIRKQMIREQFNYLRKVGKLADEGYNRGRSRRLPIKINISKKRLRNL